MSKNSNTIRTKIKIEEQKILDHFIEGIDEQLLQVEVGLTRSDLERIKANGHNLSDSYAQVMHCNYEKELLEDYQQDLYDVRNSLYDTRIEVDVIDEDGNTSTEEMKIGLHSLHYCGKDYVLSWKLPICRHYLLDNSSVEYCNKFRGRNGEICYTEYKLRLKRKADIEVDKIKSVVQMYPLIDAEAEWIVADEFLQTLLKRRKEREFQNIVFSIQRRQGEIISRPYAENLIVQGCAGSGKSMIMLHRLPILVYDNPFIFERNNIYVITPSATYIQMADGIRRDLEIQDLQMGTMQQYYDNVLKRYGIKSGAYGAIDSHRQIQPSQEQYVYSTECIKDIRTEIMRLIDASRYDMTYAQTVLSCQRKLESRFPIDTVRNLVIISGDIINKNNAALNEYRSQLISVRRDILDIRRKLQNRREDIRKGISQQIGGIGEKIGHQKKKLANVRRNNNARQIENHAKILNGLQGQRLALLDVLRKAVNDDAYYEKCRAVDQTIGVALSKAGLSENPGKGIDDLYMLVSNPLDITSLYNAVKEAMYQLDEKYLEYADSILNHIGPLTKHANKLLQYKGVCLAQDEYERIAQVNEYYTDLSRTIIDRVYRVILQGLVCTDDVMGRKAKNNLAYECSPYLYTRIAYMIQGAPSTGRENLIAIDEAQNLAPCELELLQSLNNNKVIFNLYGDVNQHIEGTKGVSCWSDFDGLVLFRQYDLEQNYRNARQITEYCNQSFGMHMEAISLDGKGVHITASELDNLDNAILSICGKGSDDGIRAIIVSAPEEAAFLVKRFSAHSKYLNDMTSNKKNVGPDVWNILTVKQSKGLEFNTVIVLAHGMTRNERYIAYTRALDELYIYDHEMDIVVATDGGNTAASQPDKQDPSVENGKSTELTPLTAAALPKPDHRPALQEPLSIPFCEYLRQKGLEVQDMRENGGYLWVIGSKQELQPYIQEAELHYRFAGRYVDGAKPIRGRSGWFTRSRV